MFGTTPIPVPDASVRVYRGYLPYRSGSVRYYQRPTLRFAYTRGIYPADLVRYDLNIRIRHFSTFLYDFNTGTRRPLTTVDGPQLSQLTHLHAAACHSFLEHFLESSLARRHHGTHRRWVVYVAVVALRFVVGRHAASAGGRAGGREGT